MTRHKPTLTTVCANVGGPDSCNAEHYVDTYLPDDEPQPQPTDPDVYFYTSPNGTYFVRWIYTTTIEVNIFLKSDKLNNFVSKSDIEQVSSNQFYNWKHTCSTYLLLSRMCSL